MINKWVKKGKKRLTGIIDNAIDFLQLCPLYMLEDVDRNSSFEICFEVFTHPKSLDTPEITLTEKKILQAQKVSFIEISVDQYQVCVLGENSNCIVNDIQYVS